MSTNLHWINSDFVYSEICKKKKSSYSRIEVEDRVREIHQLIWRNRKEIWFDDEPTPLEMLDPNIAARLIGFNCEDVSSLGQGYANGVAYEVAGIIDNKLKKIQVSQQYPLEVRNFTLAHELAHAVLHRDTGLHRDRPTDGAKLSFNEVEREADIFATAFLMPSKLVVSKFKTLFLTEAFALNQNTAYALGFYDYSKFLKSFKDVRQLSRILASAEYFNGRHFPSLAKQFKVSIETMAIRLEELSLVK
jgi:Zn-dependent peptidase ImmA (M78 family)